MKTAAKGSHRPGGVDRLARVWAGVWEFVVGDDWVTALGITFAIGATALVAAAGASAWWVMPVAVVGLLGASLWREVSGRRRL
jgi:hypothetical protein